MKVLITKADDDYWYDCATFETFNDIISYKENAGYDLTISDNYWYEEDAEVIFKYWTQEDNNFTMKDAYFISKCKYEIMIENSEY